MSIRIHFKCPFASPATNLALRLINRNGAPRCFIHRKRKGKSGLSNEQADRLAEAIGAPICEMGPFWTIDPLRERVPIHRYYCPRRGEPQFSWISRGQFRPFALREGCANSCAIPLSLSLSFSPLSLFSARPKDAAHAKRPVFLRGSNLAGIIPRDGSIRGEAVVCILSRAREWLFSGKVCPISAERDRPRRTRTMTMDT